MKRFTALALLVALLTTVFVSPVSARSSFSGGSHSYSSHSYSSPSRSSSVSHSSAPKASTPKSTTTKPATKPSTPATAPKSSSTSTKTSKTSSSSSSKKTTTSKQPTKPGSTVKTSNGKTVKSSSKKPTNSKYSRSKGIVGANGYTPGFRGYNPPYGSVVYYPQHSMLDYLPWIYLFSQSSSPRNDAATVVQPDGKQVVAQPVKEGTDGLTILNWIVMFILAAGLIVLVVYLINKYTNKPKAPEYINEHLKN